MTLSACTISIPGRTNPNHYPSHSRYWRDGAAEWRERWFVEGAAALRRHLAAIGRAEDLPPTGEYYACPCCLRAYGRDAPSDGTLTYEDVPPKSVGGRWLVLTCKQCNNTAGTRLDAQARLREEQLDFLAGRVPDRALSGQDHGW